MQNNGRRMLSDRISNKNSNKNVGGVRGLMMEYSIYGGVIEQMTKHPDQYWAEQRAKKTLKDESIIASYDAKKEELEHIYKMPDSDKKWALVKAKKAELDEMYNKYVCIRKHVYKIRQAKGEFKFNKELETLKRDLYSLGGSVMRESEFKTFLERVRTYTTVANSSVDNIAAEFTLEGVAYRAVKTKRGFLWQVIL